MIRIVLLICTANDPRGNRKRCAAIQSIFNSNILGDRLCNIIYITFKYPGSVWIITCFNMK